MLSSQTVTIFYYVLCDLTMLSNHTASQAVTVISGFPLLMTSFLSTLPSQAVTTLVIILFFDSSEFQSTLPSQAVTVRAWENLIESEFQSTLPSQAVTYIC